MNERPGIFIASGNDVDAIKKVPAGNWCAVQDLDRVFLKMGTLSTYKMAYVIKDMKFSVSPVILAAVEPIEEDDLPKLLKGLKR